MKTFRFLLIILLATDLNSSRAQDSWTQKTDFGGSPRVNAVGFCIGSQAYIGTGFNGLYRNDFWEYNTATDTWTQKADFSGTARCCAVGFSIADKGYIGTGWNGTNLNDFWEYDPALNAWTQKLAFSGNPRRFAVGFSIGEKGYIGTGQYYSGNTIYFKDFWEYDPDINIWVQRADFGGTARAWATAFSIAGKGFIGTGSSGGINPVACYKDFWEYYPESNMWTQKSNFAGNKRWDAAGFSIGSKGFIGIGYGNNYQKYSDLWEYNSAANVWTQRANYTGTVRTDAVSFSTGTNGYIGTGYSYDNAYSNELWEYTPETEPLCSTPPGASTANITTTSAELKWDPVAIATGYKIVIQMASGSGPGIATFEKSTSKEISNLEPNTIYSWQVKSVCSTDPKVTSNWSAKQFFTTGALRMGDEQTTTLELYPNPTAENFTLDLRLHSTVDQSATIYLLNTLGQIVYSSKEIAGNGELKKVITMPSTASAGWYVVRVVMNDQVMEKKLLFQK